MSENKKKIIPSLSQVRNAAAKLYNASAGLKDSVEVPIGNDYTITFERIKFKTKEKPEGSYKWTYKGRMIIDSKYQSHQDSD